MKKEELIKLSEKLGMNQEAIKHGLKEELKMTENQIVESAKFMGLIK